MNDIFLEYLVKKKSKEDVLKQVLLIFGCVLTLCAATFILIFVYPRFIGLLPIIYGIVIYATVYIRRYYSIEYEYIFTNGQLDIDKILGKTRRKSVVSLLCKNIERATWRADKIRIICGSISTEREIIDTIFDPARRGKYYIDYTQGGKKYRLLFQPPEKILENMKRYNPRNINL